VSASRRAEATDVVARVRDVLAKMKPDKALPFVLHDVMGFDLKEIAPMIGVTLAAAQRRLARGRRELRARLEADPELCRALQDLEDAP
jgi:RNA polymerase sigma-70 factor (ECF subfamily)